MNRLEDSRRGCIRSMLENRLKNFSFQKNICTFELVRGLLDLWQVTLMVGIVKVQPGRVIFLFLASFGGPKGFT